MSIEKLFDRRVDIKRSIKNGSKNASLPFKKPLMTS
jgi:hypothetical protein